MDQPRVVLAPDKFKGSLTAAEAANALAAGIRRVRPDAEIHRVPIADGGDGTVDAVVPAGYHRAETIATGPTGEPVAAAYAYSSDAVVVEAALACGLGRLPGPPDPLRATSCGVGELIRAALDTGCQTLVLGVGGSACTDGGAGMLSGLGATLRDAQGRSIGFGGAALADVVDVDLSGVDPRIGRVDVVLACDVDNPLLGPDGAAAVFAPQKGASPEQVELLEANLRRWARLLGARTGRDCADAPGAGAGGGIGYAALSALGARRVAGIELLLDLVGFDDRVAEADLVVTGEGSLDRQSLRGKAPVGVAGRAARAGKPVVAVAGRCLLTPDELAAVGFSRAYQLIDWEPDPDRCVGEASGLLTDVGTRIAAEWLAVS